MPSLVGLSTSDPFSIWFKSLFPAVSVISGAFLDAAAERYERREKPESTAEAKVNQGRMATTLTGERDVG